LVFKIQATGWFSWSCLHAETRTKYKYTFLKILSKLNIAKKPCKHVSEI
jgi:hypothetical protein